MPKRVTYYHGGIGGLSVDDVLVPSPPVVTDGCPICVARSNGHSLTIGAYRAWAQRLGPRGQAIVRGLEGQPDNAPIDPPSAKDAVYLTTSREYATWYAARTGGDLYEVEPLGELEPSTADHFPTWTTDSARVCAVLRRRVQLSRHERRDLNRMWQKADRVADRQRPAR